ncbi:MAG: hypothetical protein JSS95_07320 [Acidobacteria bacterium]|nr:hypothetical protein [Acidobacteriota bacterium]
MIGQKSISNKLLLGVIFAGLNLLCILGITHGEHLVRHTRVNYSHISVHATRRAGSRNSRYNLMSSIDAVFDHSVVDHLPKAALSMRPAAGTPSLQAAIVTRTFVLAQPEERQELLARENVVALGSAPRAPGLGRAPPIAA